MRWIDTDDDEPAGSVRMIPMDFVYIGLGLAGRLLDAASETIEDLQHVVSGHINHLRDREDFARRAGLYIESITNPQEES